MENEKFKIPFDLKGDLNIIIVPFQRWQQSLVDEWADGLEKLVKEFPNVKFYEIPSLSIGYKVMSFMIDGGMRAGIPNKDIRERTITIYINKSKFKRKLNIKSEKTIYLFLIDKEGKILWRSSGEFSQEKFDDLVTRLNQ